MKIFTIIIAVSIHSSVTGGWKWLLLTGFELMTFRLVDQHSTTLLQFGMILQFVIHLMIFYVSPDWQGTRGNNRVVLGVRVTV